MPGSKIKWGKGDVAIMRLADKIKLDNPEAISSNKLRKHIAIVRQTTMRTTKHQGPIRSSRYRHSEPKQRIIQEECQKMLAAGVIENSSSSFHSSIVIVPKKDGGHRVCVDYRRLNEAT